jgi:hypothetical protein
LRSAKENRGDSSNLRILGEEELELIEEQSKK